MAVSYIDNVAWRQVSPVQWGVNGWTADTGRILWRGARTTRDAFLASLAKWTPMPGFGYMFLENWSEGQGTISFPGIELSYVGFKNGAVPALHTQDTQSVQTAQGSGTDTTSGEQVSGTFTYIASRSIHTWFETAKPPLIPRYAFVNDQVDPFTRILRSQIQTNSDGKTTMIPYSAFVAVFNSLVKQHVVSTYEKEPIVPGRIWGCRTEVDYKLL